MKTATLFLLLLGVSLLVCFGAQVVDGLRCGFYVPADDLNRKANPKNPDYDENRKYFGAPAICNALIEPQVTFFIPDTNGTDKQAVETAAFSQGFGLGALEDVCRIPAAKFLCASAFRECVYNPLSPSLPNFFVFPLPKSPCNSLCEDMRKGCADAGITLPDCSVETDGVPNYPNKTTKFVVDPGTFKVPCQNYNNFSKSDNDELVPVVCPAPLTIRPGGDPPCQPNCPNPGLYTDDEWDKVKKVKLASSIISLACDIWIFLTILTIKERRLFPANLAISIVFIHILWMVIFVIAAARGDKTQCKNEWEFSSCWDDYLCGVEGMAIYFGALAIAFLWCALGVNLFMLVVMEIKPKKIRKYQIHVYAVSLGIPIIGATIIYATSNFYAAAGYPWCFVRPKAYNYPLFWAWIILTVLLTVVATVSTLIKMAVIKRAMSGRASLSKNINILIFVTLFAFVYTFNLVILFYLEKNSEDFEESLVATVQCNAASGGANNCDETRALGIAALYVFIWTVCGSGMFIFAAWGWSPAYIKHWKNLLGAIFTGRFSDVKDLGLSTTNNTQTNSASKTR